MAKEINQPYLFVYKIDHEKIVLKYNEDDFGDYFSFHNPYGPVYYAYIKAEQDKK